MNVSNTNNYIAYTQTSPQDMTQDQRDSVRQVVVGKAGKESKEAQLEAYVAGTQQANDTSSQTEQNSEYVQNYTDFAADVRKADNYAILVENGVDLTSIPDRPSILPIEDPSELDQGQRDSLRQAAVGIAEKNSKEAQIEAYKAGTEQANSSTSSFDETTQYVQNYNEFAADVRRSEYLNIYVQNNDYMTA